MLDNNFLKLLKPQNIFMNKVRIGPPEDGGYVMPEFVLKNSTAIMTYGVGHDTRYEEEVVRNYPKPAYLFDHTIGHTEGWERDGLKFFPEGLGYDDRCKEWFEHYKELGIEGDIFLKVDIEGYELEYFNQTDLSELRDKVLGLSLEIHWVDDLRNREKATDLLLRLKEVFVLCHIHGNNWGGVWESDGYEIPKVLELSFINRKYIRDYEPDTQDYPIVGLDIPNNPNNVEDYKLTFLKEV